MHVRGVLCIIFFSCLFSLFSSTTSRKVKYANCRSRTHACIPQARALIEKLKPLAFFFFFAGIMAKSVAFVFYIFCSVEDSMGLQGHDEISSFFLSLNFH